MGTALMNLAWLIATVLFVCLVAHVFYQATKVLLIAVKRRIARLVEAQSDSLRIGSSLDL
jgi:hypothetical protein